MMVFNNHFVFHNDVIYTIRTTACKRHHNCAAVGALLFDARQLFEQQNARADEALRSIVRQLPQAVASCVEAAGADLDPVRQAALMKASPPITPPPLCPPSRFALRHHV